jgi:hypothetical protein
MLGLEPSLIFYTLVTVNINSKTEQNTLTIKPTVVGTADFPFTWNYGVDMGNISNF